jgi:hypothetical protein
MYPHVRTCGKHGKSWFSRNPEFKNPGNPDHSEDFPRTSVPELSQSSIPEGLAVLLAPVIRKAKRCLNTNGLGQLPGGSAEGISPGLGSPKITRTAHFLLVL